jgi:hypothetical protein
MSETSLYPAEKRILEAASFDVKGEVKGCDIVAVRAGEGLTLTIVEMKLGFTLDLLLQVIDRMRAADEVWLAVPATRRGRDRDPRVHRLCRLLGFGLMAVSVTRDQVEVLVEPGKPPAGDDRIPAASACLRRVAERRARQSQRSPHRGAGCRQNSIAECLWLVRAHAARRVSAHSRR